MGFNSLLSDIGLVLCEALSHFLGKYYDAPVLLSVYSL